VAISRQSTVRRYIDTEAENPSELQVRLRWLVSALGTAPTCAFKILNGLSWSTYVGSSPLSSELHYAPSRTSTSDQILISVM
jgi:hypothetical protein